MVYDAKYDGMPITPGTYREWCFTKQLLITRCASGCVCMRVHLFLCWNSTTKNAGTEMCFFFQTDGGLFCATKISEYVRNVFRRQKHTVSNWRFTKTFTHNALCLGYVCIRVRLFFDEILCNKKTQAQKSVFLLPDSRGVVVFFQQIKSSNTKCFQASALASWQSSLTTNASRSLFVSISPCLLYTSPSPRD